jgi:hypothetical protein
MTIQEAYLAFIDTVNRNATNNNLNVDKARFVISFNETQIRYLEWLLNKRNEDVIRHASPMLVLDKNLIKSSSSDNHDNFDLPKDYFDLSNLTVYASSKKCKNSKMQSFEVKGENIDELLSDEFNKPSFYYRETFYLTNSNDVSVYKDNFSIDKVKLSYYRYPNKVDIEGYEKIDGSNSSDINPEWDDKSANRIIVAMAKDFFAANGESNKYTIEKDRLFSDI